MTDLLPAEDRARPEAWIVAAVGALIVMAGLGFGRFSYTMLLPSTRQGLDLSYTAAGLLGTANLAGYLVGSLASAAVAQRMGTRVTATGGLALLAFSLGWMGAVRGLLDAAAARALAGVAGAIVYVQALGLVAAWFPSQTRGLASGIMHSGNGAGLVLTGLGLPLMVGSASDQTWRVAWSVLALATVAILPFAWAYCRHPTSLAQEDDSEPRMMIGRRHVGEDAEDTSISTYAGLYGLFGLSYIIYATFFAESLRSRGLSLSQTGIVWALIGALSLLSGPISGMLSDRIGRTRGLAILFGLQAIAYLAFLNPDPSGLIVSVLVFGLTAWGVPAIVAAAMGDIGRAQDAATAFGRVTTVMGTGQGVGPVVAGSLADATGIASSGLWVSAIAAIVGALWGFYQSRRRV